MPEREVVDRAEEDLREGKSPSTAAGEFVHEEIEHVREGKHGARSPQQAIAIGLSKARRAGIPLAPPKPGKTKEATRKSAERDYRKGQSGTAKKISAAAWFFAASATNAWCPIQAVLWLEWDNGSRFAIPQRRARPRAQHYATHPLL
jgi:hypothetical protein